MTMQHPIHPDDERLAALAGGDPEVASDGALRAHVDSCDRCGPMVRELGSLQAALGELPDLVPSRPLQLLPPVADPQAVRGGWLRRLAAPAMAAGLVLVVVGAIGSSGFSPLGMASSAGASAQAPEAAAPSAAAGRGDAEGSASQFEGPTVIDGGYATTEPAPTGNSGQPPRTSESSSAPSGEQAGPPADSGLDAGLFAATDPRLPWLVVLGLGVGLVLAGIYFRFAVQPRAG